MPSDPPSSLTSVQRRLLEQRLRERTTSTAAIPRVPRDQALPLSFGQERLWLLHHLEPGTAAYNSTYAYRIRGPLNVAALQRALGAVVERHEILRTTISAREGEARQEIHAATPPSPLAPIAATSLDHAQQLARGIATEPFDLAHEMPVRVRLFRVSDRDHVLLLVAHHTVWDAWSTQVFWRDLSVLYASYSAPSSSASTLPPLACQYPDFAAWQRARLQGTALERLLQYWRSQLEDAPPLDLPGDRPRPAELTYAGGVVEFTWPAPLRDELQRFARRENVTLFMALLAAWNTLLHRLSGQETITTGTAVAGRARRELESLIGFFVNTLALRTECGGRPTFREFVQRVRTTTLAAYDHDELPFEKLVADLRVPRDPARHPIFQTALVLHSAPPPSPALLDLEVESLPRVLAHARFDLALTITEMPDGLRGALEFSTDLFDRTTVERWIGHLERLLRSALPEPTQRIDELPLLTTAERATLLGHWSGAPAPYPRDATVHGLVAEHARATPQAIALIEGATQLTYAALDARSDELAQRLEITPGTCVAIELDRSIAFVVSVLAVLKAGGAYVPLLKDLPDARRRLILEDTQPTALICDGTPAGEVPTHTRVIEVGPEIVVESPTASTRTQTVQAANPGPAKSSAEAPAYVMYTSGSTGRPKGVVIPHRGIVRLVRGQTPSLYRPGQRFLLLASTAFDASTFELWAPLLNGATLAIFTERWPEFDTLARAVREQHITHLFLTAGLFNQVVDHRPDILASVQHVFTGGEAMSPRHAARIREIHPTLRVTNCYGPTEVTTYTVSHEITRGEAWPMGNVPIGRPVPNARCYVLDALGQPAPIGVPGELFLGGDGLALRYLNLPEETAARFMTDPFGEPARMYRTGDRARWRADGTLEFLGRLDDQVKIRGFRIEPGEIVAVLLQHPDVRDAAVVAREDQPGELRLIGYVVARSDRVIDGAALRTFLAARLPDYMVPAALVTLPQLPLTPNGKLDRRALPAPNEAATEHEETVIAPRTPTEELVAGIWRDALKTPRVGVTNNFFALGGHSLLAMHATARLSAVLNRDVPLRWWFDHPTIADLAERIDHERADANERPITPISRTGELPLAHEEQRLWFLHHALPDPATYHVVWGWRVRGELDTERLRAALAAVMARHEILRTGYATQAGMPVRMIAADCSVPLVVEELARPDGASGDLVVQRRIAGEVRHPFTLDHPPLWRATVLRLAPQDQLLVLTAHHLICDEWSLPIFHRELAAAYIGEGAQLAPLQVQYVDYAAWQRQRVASMQRARDFWREHLDGAPAGIALPTDPVRPGAPTGTGRRVHFSLARESVEALDALGRTESTTAFVVWLSAFAAFLARWSAQSDLVIGTPLAQRNRAELQPLIGFFLNTLPLRVRISAGTTFRTLLRDVRTTVLHAMAHGDLPLDEIAAAHPRPRGATGGALFNVMFALREEPRPTLTLPGIGAEPLDLGTGTAKADLTLFIERSHDEEPRGSFEFAMDALTPPSMEDAMREMQRTLTLIATTPDRVLVEARELSRAAADGGGVTPAAVEAPPEIQRQLTAIWRRLLRRAEIGVNESFFELGGHSLLAMQLGHEVQQQFGRTIPLARMLATPTIAGLAQALAPTPLQPPAGTTAWKGVGQGTPYFHVPGMNGVEFLPPAVAIRIGPDRRWFDGLQHPGVDGREHPARSLPAIAAELVRQIHAAQPRGPYVLGGFCHGGLVAYEVARQLEAQGEVVAGLVLWDTFPEQCWKRRPVADMIALLRRKLASREAGTFIADRWRFFWHRVSLGLQFLGRVVRARLPGERGRIEARMISAGMAARRRYQPAALRAPVLLVRSRDERVFVEKLPLDGWAGAITGPLEVVDLPHWHFHLLREPAVSALAERTAEFLRRIDRSSR